METESDVGLGLNEHHQKNLWNYLRFIRYIKSQNIRTIDSCFQDVKNSKLNEDTYTVDEVKKLVEEILDTVKIDIEAEWSNLTHTNAVLLKQLFTQAERWHLKLAVDTSQLENIDLLSQVKEFEELQAIRNQKTINESPTKFHLEPLNDIGNISLLQQEIDELKEENAVLRERLKTIESQASTFLNDRSKLTEEIRKLKSECELSATAESETTSQELSSLNEQLTQAKVQLETLRDSASKKEDLETNLTKVTHQLLQVQDMLERKEKDLEAKVNQTPAFINLKKMLHQKNELVKSLRKKLEKYELNGNQDDVDDEV